MQIFFQFSFRWLLVATLTGIPLAAAGAEDAEDQVPVAPQASQTAEVPESTGDLSVEDIAARVKNSIVVVSVAGRDGKRQGLGTGFVVSKDGLIATNMHVIDEGRPVTVQFADGKKYDVKAVHASDRHLDLAVLRIEANNLQSLELGDSDSLEQGQSVVAMGNPQGLEHSVVAGIVSGRREIDDKPMIQLAIPIEPGNSGGPLLDRQMRVHGLLTMKSLVTANLGFAVAVNALKPLLAKPNPVSMDRWMTIGRLDPRDWSTFNGARWRQRAGRIVVDQSGHGFGGRSYCLAEREVPELPYEVGVQVKIEDASGAAGLVFHAKGDQHYGFYITNNNLRLTRFEGPDVLTWTVLETVPSEHFKPDEWNFLKVRIEKDHLRCYVNDHLVIESNDSAMTSGKVGLTKFRDTSAEFKQFALAKKLPSLRVDGEAADAIRDQLTDTPLDNRLIEELLDDGRLGVAVLRDEADALEQKAKRLRQMAQRIHDRNITRELVACFNEKPVNLLKASLLLARLDNEDVDVDAYCQQFERLAEDATAEVKGGKSEAEKLVLLNRFLFEQCGFHGSRNDYYNRANSYLNEVLDDREGLPITLSVLYMELARRIGIEVVGVGLPGHFIAKHIPSEGKEQLIDVFEGGTLMSREQAAEKVADIAGIKLRDEHLEPASSKAILLRMLANLLGLARRNQDQQRMLRYLNATLALAPESGFERGMRAVLLLQDGDLEAALRDAEWLLDHRPPGVDLNQVQQLRSYIQDKLP